MIVDSLEVILFDADDPHRHEHVHGLDELMNVLLRGSGSDILVISGRIRAAFGLLVLIALGKDFHRSFFSMRGLFAMTGYSSALVYISGPFQPNEQAFLYEHLDLPSHVSDIVEPVSGLAAATLRARVVVDVLKEAEWIYVTTCAGCGVSLRYERGKGVVGCTCA